LLSILVGIHANAAPVTLDFEDLPAGTSVSNQYQSRGVIFSNHFIANGNGAGVPFTPHSGSQALTLASSSDEFRTGPIVAQFTRAMTTVTLFAGAPFDAPGQQGTLRAFDSQANLLATDGPKPLGPALDTPFSVSVSTATIASITFTQSPHSRPWIDDLTFDDGGASVILPIAGNHTNNVDVQIDQPLTGPVITTPSVWVVPPVGITQPGGTGNNGGSVDPQGEIACTGSRANNVSWTYYHDAFDYETDASLKTADCGACGCSTPSVDQLPGQMQRLRIKRLLRPHLGYVVSSFGPAMFGTFDAKIRWFPGNTPRVDVFDIESDVQPLSMVEISAADGDNAVDGVFHDVVGRQNKDLRLIDANGNPTSQAVPGAIAILTRQTGERLIFEMINTQPSGSAAVLDGRLIRSEDRNHNAEVVSYVFGATATDTQLSNDRTRLWQISSLTDPYGVAASFQYGNQQVSGRWVVTQITAPTGQTVQYRYNGGTNIGLTGVTFPDGSSASFSTSLDSANQEIGLSVDDNAAGAFRVRKTVYLSQATITLPSGQVVSQPANLVRRVFNGAGEIVYRNWENPNSLNTYYIYEGGGALIRITVSSDGFVLSYARASAPFDPTKDPTTASFDVQESYSEGIPTQLTQTTDATGRSASLTRDSLTRAVTATTYYDGSSASATYNQFREPIQVIDNVGKVTTASYDGAGNLLSMTVAAGTPQAGTLSLTYNSRGQPLTSTDANGNVTNFQYDAAGNLTAVTEPSDVVGGARAVTRMAYDAAGRMTSRTDADGRSVQLSYDGRNRLVTQSFPDGSNEIFAYGSGATANLLVSRRDRNGHADTYSYDAASRPTGVVYASGMPESVSDTWTYISGTTLRAQEVKSGEQTAFTYDQRKRRVATTRLTSSSQSLAETVRYDLVNRRIQLTDPYGRSTFFVYDRGGRQTRIVTERVPGAVPSNADLPSLARDTSANPGYTILDRTFDAQGRPALELDGRGIRTSYAYDIRTRLIQKIVGDSTPDAAKTTYQYDAQGNATVETRPRSFGGEGGQFATASIFSSRNLLLSRTDASGTSDASTTSYTYTPTRQKATMKDGRGNVTGYTYDTCCNRVVQVTEPGGQITKYTYDFNGNRASTTDPNGNVTHETYDALNRRVSVVDPRGKTTSTTYDDNLTDGVGIDSTYQSIIAGLSFGIGADGSAVLTTDPLGHVAISVRDPLGREVRSVDGNLNFTTRTYDVITNGLVERSTTDALGHITVTRSDGQHLARQSVDAAGNLSTFTFDAAGNQLQSRDPNGTGQDCAFDSLNRRTACTDTAGDTTSFTYDVEGNELTHTDGQGSTTRCTYDARNRKKSCTDRIGGVQSFVYDANSNLLQMTDSDGSTTSYQYDARNLQTKITFPDGGVRQLGYDPGRRLTSLVQQDNTTITYAYDTANRLITRHYPDSQDDTLGYDDANRLTQASSARYQTNVVRTYDAANRITSDAQTVFAATYSVSYAYDAANRVTGFTYPDGSTVARQYTSRNQLASVSAGSSTLAAFTYDAGKRLTALTFGNGETETRSYRNDNLVASAVTPGVAGFDYTYDHDKRKKTEGDRITAAESQSFVYDGEDRPVSWSKQAGDSQTWQLSPADDWRSTVRNGVTETRTHDAAHATRTVNGTALAYDPKGNLTADNRGHVYAWDFDNRIATSTIAGQRTKYTYDALGRRVGKTIGGVATILVNADEQVIAEYSGSTLARKYIYGDYADRVIALIVNGATYFYSANTLYSVAALTSSTGAVVERYHYDAFGKRTVILANGSQLQTSSVGNPFGFTGRYHDDESGLIYFRARYYDPTLGRFISRDKHYRDGPNLYAAYFVPNRLDPTGEGFKAGIVGEADLEIQVCDGGKLNAVLKAWAGVGYDAYGYFVGISWEGTLTKNIASGFFKNRVTCGTECAPCCEDPRVPSAYGSVGLATILPPIKDALEAIGVECQNTTKANACVFGLGFDCQANLIDYAFPELKPILDALKEVGVKVAVGFHLALDMEWCKSVDAGTALKEWNFDGGAYVEVGVGV
jgi:RHS repeat-associated protein